MSKSILHRIIILLFTFPPSLCPKPVSIFNDCQLSYRTFIPRCNSNCVAQSRIGWILDCFFLSFFFLHHVFIIFAAKGVLRVIIIKKCNIYIYILYSIYLLRVEIYFSFHIFLDEIGMLLALYKNIHPCVDECRES